MTIEIAGYHLPRPKRRRPAYAVRKETAIHATLTLMLWLALWRGTGMWYGYPSVFDESNVADSTPMKLVLYAIIPLMLIYVWLEQRPIVAFLASTSKLLMVVAVFSLASVAVSLDTGASIRGIAAVLVLATGSLIYRMRYGNVQTFRAVSNFLIFSAFFNIFYTIVLPQYAIMGGSYAGMIKGAFSHKNGLGQFASFGVVILFANRRSGRGVSYRDLVTWAAILCFFALIVASRSSTSLFMALVGIIVTVTLRVVQKIPSKNFRASLVGALFLLVFLGSAISYLGVAQAIADAFDKDLTFSGRTVIWDQLIPLIYQRPFLGYGFAMFRQPEVMLSFVSATFGAKSTHNTYLELALNIGVIGATCWILYVLATLFDKAVEAPRSGPEGKAFATEIAVICMALIGGLMEAGVFLSPGITWPLTVIALCNYRTYPPAQARQTRFSRRVAGSF